MKKIVFIIMALAILIPGGVYADSNLPPSIPLMIDGTAPEGMVTVEINDNVYEVYSDGKFYIPVSGKAGDIITITQGDTVVTETYVNPMDEWCLSVAVAHSVTALESPAPALVSFDDDDEPGAELGFSSSDMLWILKHGGYVY